MHTPMYQAHINRCVADCKELDGLYFISLVVRYRILSLTFHHTRINPNPNPDLMSSIILAATFYPPRELNPHSPESHTDRRHIPMAELAAGKYQLSVAEGLVLRQTGLPSWKGPLPQVVSGLAFKALRVGASKNRIDQTHRHISP